MAKAKSRVNERATAADRDPAFSPRIRDGVPGVGVVRLGRALETSLSSKVSTCQNC
jgi:hypothetical protein